MSLEQIKNQWTIYYDFWALENLFEIIAIVTVLIVSSHNTEARNENVVCRLFELRKSNI